MQRGATGFVGLDNQYVFAMFPFLLFLPVHVRSFHAGRGATCYLNSLLQSLFMTPELRGGLYTVTDDELGIQARVLFRRSRRRGRAQARCNRCAVSTAAH